MNELRRRNRIASPSQSTLTPSMTSLLFIILLPMVHNQIVTRKGNLVREANLELIKWIRLALEGATGYRITLQSEYHQTTKARPL